MSTQLLADHLTGRFRVRNGEVCVAEQYLIQVSLPQGTNVRFTAVLFRTVSDGSCTTAARQVIQLFANRAFVPSAPRVFGGPLWESAGANADREPTELEEGSSLRDQSHNAIILMF